MHACMCAMLAFSVRDLKCLLTKMGLHLCIPIHTNKRATDGISEQRCPTLIFETASYTLLRPAKGADQSAAQSRLLRLAGPETHTRTSPVQSKWSKRALHPPTSYTSEPGAYLSTPHRQRFGCWGVLGCRKVGMYCNATLQEGKGARLDQKGIQPTPPNQKGK